MGEGEKDDLPHIRKVGRYSFYLLCAFALSLMSGLICTAWHLPEWVRGAVTTAVLFGAFLTLRDIEKNAYAEALRRRQ